MVKEIILSGNKGIALVDDDDFNELNQYKWRFVKDNGDLCYAQTNIKSEKTRCGYTTVRMHRVILKLQYNESIDHINHNGLDNRKINLRTCNSSQNSGNRRKTKNKTSSRYKGVSLYKRNKKWDVSIYFNYNRIYLGCFDTEELAALAYNKKAVELFGDFAYLNTAVG